MCRVSTALLVFLTFLNLSILTIRLHSLVDHGHLTATTGTEGPMIYGVWKASHNHPLYESPESVSFSPTLYNFLFYRAYALPLKALGLEGDRFLAASRLVTLLFGCLGAALGLIAVRVLRGPRGGKEHLWAILAVMLFWFGATPVGWFELSVRPDLGAVCFAAAGLLCFLYFLRGRNALLLVLSSLSFFLAWSFKQSVVLTFVATILVGVIFMRRWKWPVLQIAPFAVCTLAALSLGGATYRFNILTIPTFATVKGWMSVGQLAVKTIAENPTLYVIPMIALAVVLARGWRSAEQPGSSVIESNDSQVRLLGAILLVVLCGTVVLCSRTGSDRNYFFEAGMVGSLAAAPSVRVLAERFGSRTRWLTLPALGVTVVFCLLQLTALSSLSGRGDPVQGRTLFGATEFGRLRLLSQAEVENRSAVVAAMSQAPKPILINDDVFSQPWHSSEDRFPAFVIDPNLLKDLERKKVLLGRTMERLIRMRQFRTLFLREQALAGVAQVTGYQHVSALPGGWTVYAIPAEARAARRE